VKKINTGYGFLALITTRLAPKMKRIFQIAYATITVFVIFALGNAQLNAASSLFNISTRGWVGLDNQVLIGLRGQVLHSSKSDLLFNPCPDPCA
jgi:hypothetical protein